jgi:hypothetical protein
MNRIYLIVISLIILLTSSQLIAQAQLKAVWDYPDLEIGTIARFEVKIDDGTYESIGIPSQQTLPTTLPGAHSYVYVIPFTVQGTHVIAVRACDAVECSFDATVPYKWIGPPRNLFITR